MEDAAPLITRRAVLGGGALVLAALAASGGCGVDDGPEDALATLGRSLAEGPSGAELLAAAGPAARDAAGPAAVLALLHAAESQIREDFLAHRTVTGQGWLLAFTEASLLAAYGRR